MSARLFNLIALALFTAAGLWVYFASSELPVVTAFAERPAIARAAPPADAAALLHLSSSAAPGPSGLSAGPPSSAAAEVKDLLDLKDCYKRDCGFPRMDPRSYDLALGQKIKMSLQTLAGAVREQRLQDFRLSDTARDFLALDDGNVKEGALDLLATQPPSDENLHSILSDVIDNADAELVDQAMLELERYSTSTDRVEIDHALAHALLHGSPFVAKEISEKIGPLLNSTNGAFYKDVAAELESESAIKNNLLARLHQVNN